MVDRAKIITINKIHKAVSFPQALQMVLNQYQHLRQGLCCSHQPQVPAPNMQIQPKGLVSTQQLDANRFHGLWSCCGTKSLSFWGFAEEPTRRDEKGVAQPCFKCMHLSPRCKTRRSTTPVDGNATPGPSSSYKQTICLSVG